MVSYRERAEHSWTEDSVRLIMTPSEFAKTALYYVQEIGHFRTLSSYFTERERLDSFLIVYTESGMGRLSYRDKDFVLHPNQVFFINCMEYQYYAAQPGQQWELLWVHLNGQSIRAYYDLYSLSGEIVRTLEEDSGFPAVMQELIQLHHGKSIRNELIASKVIVELLTELILTGSYLDTVPAEMPSYIAAALRLIDKRYVEKISLEYLSKTLAVNKYHLAKEFKKHTGFSPGEYIINTRITRAKELLKYSFLSVAEISEQIGIDNVSHFIRLFKERAEVTPLVFRKKWQAPK